MNNSVARSIGIAVFALGCAAAIPRSADAQTAPKPASMAGTWNMGLIGDHVIPVALVLEQDDAVLKGTYIFMGREFAFAGTVDGNSFTLKGTSPLLGRPGQQPQHTGSAPAGAAAPSPASAAAAFDVRTATVVETTITGSLSDDGAMAGNVDVKIEEGKTGRIKWTAERLKVRPVPSVAAGPSIDLNGNWKMSINEAQLHMDVTLKQEGTKVTGTATSEHLGTMNLEGTYANGTVSFVTTGSVSGQDVKIEYSGKTKADGTLAGDLTSQMGAMTWSAERVKK
jgi:hypothetical protein